MRTSNDTVNALNEGVNNKKYISIKKEEFEQVLTSTHPLFELNDHMSRDKWELVYSAPIRNTTVKVVVFSSIVDNKTRGCGEDAIRITLFETISNKKLCGSKRINRIPGWEKRLSERILEVAKSASKHRCSCGGYMLEKKRKADGKTFFGCSCYPNCKNTKNELQ